jgi:hypothetical protein
MHFNVVQFSFQSKSCILTKCVQLITLFIHIDKICLALLLDCCNNGLVHVSQSNRQLRCLGTQIATSSIFRVFNFEINKGKKDIIHIAWFCLFSRFV